MKKLFCRILLLVLLFGCAGSPTARAEIIVGPIPARLLRVIDGDTVLVELSPWFGQKIEVSVRLAGIDAPELKSRCAAEREMALKAREYLRQQLGETIQLYDIRKGKYFGRVIGRLQTDNASDVSALLLKKKLVIPYDGKARKTSYCLS